MRMGPDVAQPSRVRRVLPASRRGTLAVLSVGVGSFGLLQSLIIPVLLPIQERYDASTTAVAWVLTSYMLSAAVATPVLGRIGDAVSKSLMFTVTLLLLSGGSVVAAFAPTLGWLIAARVVQGLGGGVLPLAFGIIRDEFPARKAGPAVGAVAALVSASFGIGLVLAGPIVEGLGYRWLFLLPALATSAAALAAQLVLRASPVRSAGRISAIPAPLLAGWLIALLLGLSFGERAGWGSLVVIGSMIVAAVLFVAWLCAESRVRVPLIDLELLRLRGIWTANTVVFLVGFSQFAVLGFLPQMLQSPTWTGYGFGSSITETGRVLLPMAVLATATGFLGPHLVFRSSARAVVIGSVICHGVSLALLAQFHDHLWQIMMWMGLQGIGAGLVSSSLAGVVLASVGPEHSGVASGMNANIRMIGGSVGSAVMAVIVASVGPTVGALPAEAGYRAGFWLLCGSMVVAAVVASAIPAHDDRWAERVRGTDGG